ncbi:hypothetical protein D915_003385 [Fasciola hepatica]|uniref:Uncharacterized protein n=1 Tax=Fasciola hepatica TaxID=6192 RepID=A0A4E0RD85_FASHE|nr:hypothetical protein D915_003385 [Fasciola hepatica]
MSNVLANDSQSYWKTVTDADVKGPKAKIILALKYTDGGDTCEKNGMKMENFFKMALYDALANSGLQALVRVKCIISIGEPDNRFHLMQLGVSPQIFSDYQLLNSDTESAIEASMKTYMDKHSYKFRVLSAIGATKKNEIGVQMTGPVNCGVGSDWNNGLIWDHQGSLTKQMSETNTNLQDALSILEPNLEKPIVSKIVYIRPVENKIHMKFIAHLQAHRDDIDDLAKQKNILKSLNEVLKCEGKKVTGTRVTMWNGKWKPIY